MPGIALLDELAWPEDMDGKTSLPNGLSADEDVPAIQGQKELAQKELTAALHRGRQDVGTLGIDK